MSHESRSPISRSPIEAQLLFGVKRVINSYWGLKRIESPPIPRGVA